MIHIRVVQKGLTRAAFLICEHGNLTCESPFAIAIVDKPQFLSSVRSFVEDDTAKCFPSRIVSRAHELVIPNRVDKPKELFPRKVVVTNNSKLNTKGKNVNTGRLCRSKQMRFDYGYHFIREPSIGTAKNNP